MAKLLSCSKIVISFLRYRVNKKKGLISVAWIMTQCVVNFLSSVGYRNMLFLFILQLPHTAFTEQSCLN